jgi:hypothetical protein
MKRILAITGLAIVVPCITMAASRTYDIGAFEEVSVSAGIEVDITAGPNRSVVAENRSDKFDDLRISVEGKVLNIGRPAGSWFSSWFSGGRPDYQVHVVAPALRSLSASSGSEVGVKGPLEGDFSVTASSGSEVHVTGIRGGNVKASVSSGSEVEIEGTCVSLQAEASSGSDLEADDLKCEAVTVNTSSGSDVSVSASKRVSGNASSGSDVTVKGRPPEVHVEKSSGADVTLRD